jgi:hypothetical protein
LSLRPLAVAIFLIGCARPPLDRATRTFERIYELRGDPTAALLLAIAYERTDRLEPATRLAHQAADVPERLRPQLVALAARLEARARGAPGVAYRALDRWIVDEAAQAEAALERLRQGTVHAPHR